MNTRIIRKQNSLTADMEEILVVYIEDQTNHNIPLSESESCSVMYCKQCSGFLGVHAHQWDCWVVWQFYFQFFKESPHCSPQWLY